MYIIHHVNYEDMHRFNLSPLPITLLPVHSWLLNKIPHRSTCFATSNPHNSYTNKRTITQHTQKNPQLLVTKQHHNLSQQWSPPRDIPEYPEHDGGAMAELVPPWRGRQHQGREHYQARADREGASPRRHLWDPAESQDYASSSW